MTYCQICGCFSVTNEKKCPQPKSDCHSPWRFYTEEERQRLKMLSVTTENLFCGRCNKIFPKDIGWKLCPICFRQPLYPVKEFHPKGNVILLSGLGAARIWD